MEPRKKKPTTTGDTRIMEKLKIGIIGAGQIAYKHIEKIREHSQAEVAAVADINEVRRREFASQFNLPKSYASAEELIADRAIHAVSIALPNALHAATAIAALNAGKHVLLEKPMAMNLNEAEKIADAAEKSGKVFMVGMNQRYSRDSQTIKAIVQRGELGDIYHAKAFWMRRSGIPKIGTWFCQKEKSGGGALLDIGVHLLDLCLHLTGHFKPTGVFGATYSNFGPRGLGHGSWGMSDSEGDIFDVEDFATAMIRFENGTTVNLDASWAIHQSEPSRSNVVLYGTEAGAGVFPPEIYRYGHVNGEYEVVSPQGVDLPHPKADRFDNWINVILGTEEPLVTVEESLVVQRILDGIYASCLSGREIPLN